MSRLLRILSFFFMTGLAACGGGTPGGSSESALPPIVVNSLADTASPPQGSITLRSAIEQAEPGQRIVFDRALDRGTITLSIVADEHTRLTGEVMGIRDEPSGPVSYLVGWFDRDYGRSALVARKDVVIDASGLASGITIAWDSNVQPGARILAVDGNLTLRNVSIRGGRSIAEAKDAVGTHPQPWTLARGAALAVWGVARLEDCRLFDNHVQGDFESSRDRGAFGGAVYADIVEMRNCVVAGNSAVGAGAAGGGVYSVGGAEHPKTLSTIQASSVTGNRIQGLFAYGAGVYSDGGGIGNRKTMRIVNSTVARNLVEPAQGLPPFLLTVGYWRGGGIYMSNGYLEVQSCTVVENEVHGIPRTDSLGRDNLAGGIAATVGNAHATEHMVLGHSIVAGNRVRELGGREYPQDVFTGSLFYFRSAGYNRLGVLDFSQMLVPVGEWGWESLSRKHYPQVEDEDGVEVGEVVDLVEGVVTSPEIVSVGVVPGEPVVLYYQPRGSALGKVPAGRYRVPETLAQYQVDPGGNDDFLRVVLLRLEGRYGPAGFAADFVADIEEFLRNVDSDPSSDGVQPYRDPSGQPILTLEGTRFFGPAQTWPRELANHPYILFWHRLDAALEQSQIPGLGPELMGDSVWQTLFTSGYLPENPRIRLDIQTEDTLTVERVEVDQLGAARPSNAWADIGAIEAI